MNIRNIQIFGIPRKYKTLFGIAVIITIAVLVIASQRGEFLQLDFLQQKTEIKEDVTETTTDTTSQNETAQTTEERTFSDYPAECAAKVRRAEDNVKDIKEGYLNLAQEELEKLIKEYEEKIKEIEDRYGVDIKNLEVKVEKGNRELEIVEKNLAGIKAECDKELESL